MGESYQDDAYQDEYAYEAPPPQVDDYEYEYDYQPEPKKGMSGWLIALIIVLVIIVVCCVCLCLGSLLLGPSIGNVFSNIVETMEVPVGP